jgi:hypothetical protein
MERCLARRRFGRKQQNLGKRGDLTTTPIDRQGISVGQLCLLKSPFLLRQLMLRPTMDTLLAMMSVLLSFLLTMRTWARARAALQLEVLALRHQLQVLHRTRPRRLRLAKADRHDLKCADWRAD